MKTQNENDLIEISMKYLLESEQTIGWQDVKRIAQRVQKERNKK